MKRTHLRPLTRLAFVPSAALVLVAGCGSSTGPGPGGGNANFTATVNGAAWTSAAAATQVIGAAGGVFTIVGGDLVAHGTSISITLRNIDSPGTYPLGVGPTVRGGTGAVVAGSNSQFTGLSGRDGVVTLTAVSATHITGSFTFSAGTGANAVTVTQGTFDLPVTTSGGSIAVPDYAWNLFSGTLGGAPWNAATVVMVSAPPSGTLGMGISNDAYQITLIISGFAGPGTYALNTGVSRYVTVSRTGAGQNWGGSPAASAGNFTVTSQTATRMAGTYDFTLQPLAGASGNLQLSGTFDFGIAP